MTKEREDKLIALAKANCVRGVTKEELKELEAKYGVKCESYSCSGCIQNFFARIINKHNL